MSELFSRTEFSSYTDTIKKDIKVEIDRCDNDYITKIEIEKYCKFLITNYSIETISVFFEKVEILEPIETETVDRNIFGESIMSPATQYTLIIPFEGNSDYFYYIPNHRQLRRHKEGRINGSELHITFILSDYSRTTLDKEIKEVIADIKFHINSMNNDVKNFNNTLERFIIPLIQKRKEKLGKISSVVSSLNIPIRSRDNPVSPLRVPIEKKRIKLKRPEVPKHQTKPYWILEYEMYEEILTVCFNMSAIMERTPHTYSKMPEESIRDIFLAHLNGHFEGGVSGETFNKKGKTDILIQVNNDIVFIAECKIWKGEKLMLETIDQLFNYITWRETKAAIFIFNKDIKITTVLGKIENIMKKHKNYSSLFNLKSGKLKRKGIFGYKFDHPDDKNIEVTLTVLVFNFNID